MRNRLLLNRFGRFGRDEEGTITIEFVVIFPVLFSLLILSFEVFDAFKSYSRASKATYAVSDIVSRQTSVTQKGVEELHMVLDSMMPWLNEEKWLRVTSFSQDKNGYKVEWSHASGTDVKLTTATLSQEMKDMLPEIAVGDTVVLTEASIPHRSLVRWIGLDDVVWSIEHTVRPRFIAAIAGTEQPVAGAAGSMGSPEMGEES